MAPASATIPRMAIGCPDHGSNRSGADPTTKVDSFRAFLAKEFVSFRPYVCLRGDDYLSGRQLRWNFLPRTSHSEIGNFFSPSRRERAWQC